MESIKMGSYEMLKESICKLNGIEVKKQVEKVGNYLV